MVNTKRWRYLTPRELEILDKQRAKQRADAIKRFDPNAPLVMLDDCDPVLR